MKMRKSVGPVRWANRDGICVNGYIGNVIPVMIWVKGSLANPPLSWNITIGGKFYKAMPKLEDAMARVEKRWEIYAQKTVDKMRDDGIGFARPRVLQGDYAYKICHGMWCAIRPDIALVTKRVRNKKTGKVREIKVWERNGYMVDCCHGEIEKRGFESFEEARKWLNMNLARRVIRKLEKIGWQDERGSE